MFKLPSFSSARVANSPSKMRTARRRLPRPSPRLLVESLEDRLLLSHFRGAAMIPSVSAGGLLTLTSTSFWRPDFVGEIGIDVNANPVVTNLDTNAVVGSMVDGSRSPDDASDSRFTKVVQTHTIQLPGPGSFAIQAGSCCRVLGIQNATAGTQTPPPNDWEMDSIIVWNGSAANTPITFNFSAVQPEVVKNQDYTGNLSAVPAPGITLSYDQALNLSINLQPPGFTINTSTGALSIPAASTATYMDNTAGNAGADYAFSGNIIASDGSKVEFDWMFDAVDTGTGNLAPTVNDAIINANPAATIMHTFTGSDPDGDTLTWSFDKILGPGGASPAINPTFDPGTRQITWNTTGSALGTWSVQVQARDTGGLTDIGVLTVNLGAAVPAVRGKIVFANSGDSGGGEIYTMNPDGTGVLRLTNDPSVDGGPAWSPDGTRIVFWRSQSGTSDEIFVMNVDGTGQTQLTNDASSDRNPRFSPNGTRIVYQHAELGSGWEIYVMNANGTGQTRLTNDLDNAIEPQWSPDGTRIVFVSSRLLGYDIWVMNTDGSGATQLTNLVDAHDFTPDWSPDGQKIIFFRRILSGADEIWIMNADGTGQTRLSGNLTVPRSRPTFSPDGTKIFYYQNPPGASTDDVVPVTINPDGSGEKTIVTSFNPRVGTDPDWGTAPATSSGPFMALASGFFGDLFRFRVPTGLTDEGFVERLGNMGTTMTDIAIDAAGNLFGVDATSALYRIDLATVVPTRIGDVGAAVNALTFGANGTLYAAGSSLYTISTTTGLGTLVGGMSGFVSEGDLAFDDAGTLYMTTTTDQLVRVNPATGDAVAVAPTLGRGTGGLSGNYEAVTGLFFGPDRTLYGISETAYRLLSLNMASALGASHDVIGEFSLARGATLAPRVAFDIFAGDRAGKLFRINALTGAVTVIGNMGTVMTDLAQDAGGALFGADATSALYSINATTAAATRVGDLGASVTALAFSPGGTLYAAGTGLFTVDVATGRGTLVGNFPGSPLAGDMAFDARGRLFMTFPSDERFSQVDPVNALPEVPSDVWINDVRGVFGLAYGPDGVMYALSDETQQLFTANLNVGPGHSPALWADYGVPTISGTLGAATPPPAARSAVEFSASSYQVNESAGTATITVTRTGKADTTDTIRYATGDGTATAGLDYDSASGTLIFVPGQTSQSFTITIRDDLLVEPNETVILTLTTPTGAAALGSVRTAMLDIQDDDTSDCVAAPAGLVSWFPGDGNANDAVGGNNGTLMGGTSFAPGKVGQAFSFDGIDDFVQVPDAANLKPANVTVDTWVRFDALDTPGAFPPGRQYIVFKKNTRASQFEGYTLLKLRDGGGVDRLNFAIAAADGTQIVTKSTTAVTVGQFYHVAGTYDGTTATLYVNGVLEDSRLAGFPLDYGSSPLFFGSSGESFNEMRGLVDEVDVYNRALSATEIQGIFSAGSAGKCQPASLPTVSIDPISVTEGNTGTTDAVFNVRLSAAASQAVVVNFQTENGTATAGSDYVALTNSVTIPAGQTASTIRIQVTGDQTDEPDETFSVRITSASNATVAANTVAVGTINDDDPTPVLSIDPAAVTEGNVGTTDAVFNVRLSGASSQAVIVNFQTENGTATAGSDYVAVTNSVTIPAGQTAGTISIQVTSDQTDEPDEETFSVRITGASNATVPANTVAIGTINDDDPFVIPALSINDVSVIEGNAGRVDAVFTITPSLPPTRPLRVTYSTSSDSATAGSDFDAVPATTVTMNPGETSLLVTIQVIGDTIDEIDELFTVNISSPDGSFLLDGEGIGTIRDDDLALGRITGMKFDDRNGSAVKDPGEPGLAGWVIFLDNNNNGIRDGSVETNTRNATTVPQLIPGGGTVGSMLPVTGLVGPIRDVNVRLDITHSFVGDLAITLVSPSGTRVQLVAEDSLPPLELDEDNFTNTTFDDEAATPITSGEAPFSASFRPMNPLSAFDGQFASGTWTLEISDIADRDEGSLDSWSLTIQTDETDRAATTDAAGNYAFDNLADGSYRVREVPQTDWLQTTPNPGPVAVTRGSNAAGIDFGNRRDALGPTIERVDVVRDARGKKVLQVVLSFNERLAPSGPGSVANYLLEKVGRRSRKPVPISSALYNDAARTVTLNLSKTISAKALANYELTVRDTGSLTDLFNNRLDGNLDGTPGGNFVRPLSQGAILSVVDELLESGELSGRRLR